MFTLDAYAARSCPLKVHHAFHPGLTRPAPTGTVNRIPGAAEFLSSAYAAILAGAPGTVDLRGLDEDLYDYLPLYAEAMTQMGAGGLDYAAMAGRGYAAESAGNVRVAEDELMRLCR